MATIKPINEMTHEELKHYILKSHGMVFPVSKVSEPLNVPFLARNTHNGADRCLQVSGARGVVNIYIDPQGVETDFRH